MAESGVRGLFTLAFVQAEMGCRLARADVDYSRWEFVPQLIAPQAVRMPFTALQLPPLHRAGYIRQVNGGRNRVELPIGNPGPGLLILEHNILAEADPEAMQGIAEDEIATTGHLGQGAAEAGAEVPLGLVASVLPLRPERVQPEPALAHVRAQGRQVRVEDVADLAGRGASRELG